MVMNKKMVGLIILGVLLLSALMPFISAKDTKYDKLKDVKVIGDASKKLDKTLAKNFIEVEAGFGVTTNATVTVKEDKLTLLITDDVNSAGRWFRINSKVLKKFNLNIDLVNVYVDGKKAEKAFEEDKDGKWLLFYVDHFSTREITFEASEGYVELADWSYENYVKLLEENPSGQFNLSGTLYDYALWQGNEADLPAYLNATLFCPLDELDTVNNVTPCYLNKSLINATVSFNESTGYPKLVSGWIKNALEFDGNTSEYIDTGVHMNITNEFTIIITVHINSISSNVYYINQDYSYTTDQGFNLRALMSDTAKLAFEVGDTSLKIDIQPEKTYIVVAKYCNGSMTFKVYDENYNLVGEVTGNNVPAGGWGTASLRIGATSKSSFTLDGWIDEFRFYTKALTDEEEQLLLHLSRHKTAQLSAPSASYDGSQFLVNVTAQLPGDGGSYVLPAPKDAQGLTAIGQIGNFTFLDAGTAGEVSYTLPVSEDLSCPEGINLLAWLYDNEIYMTGAEDEFPIMATIMHLPKGVWYTIHGEIVYQQITTTQTTLVIANVTSPASLVTRYPDIFINPQNNYVNVTEIQKSKMLVMINASAPSGEVVTFTIRNLHPEHRYRIFVDGEEIDTVETGKSGDLAFTWNDWSDHLFEIKAYSSGEEWYNDAIDNATIMLSGIILVPILALIFLMPRLLEIIQALLRGEQPVISDGERTITGIVWMLLIFSLAVTIVLLFSAVLKYLTG